MRAQGKTRLLWLCGAKNNSGDILVGSAPSKSEGGRGGKEALSTVRARSNRNLVFSAISSSHFGQFFDLVDFLPAHVALKKSNLGNQAGLRQPTDCIRNDLKQFTVSPNVSLWVS